MEGISAMRITIELRRPSRRAAALLVGMLLLAVPGVALASHQFSDVPTSHRFHDDIDWLADYGIAAGYGDGTYRPTQAVTRQAMAAFLHRLSNEIEVVYSSADPGAGTSFSHIVPCPEGKRAIAGGGYTSEGNLFITDTNPLDTAWLVRWETDNNATANPTFLTVYATCVPRL